MPSPGVDRTNRQKAVVGLGGAADIDDFATDTTDIEADIATLESDVADLEANPVAAFTHVEQNAVTVLAGTQTATELTFPVEANATYIVRGFVLYESVTATEAILFGQTGPVGLVPAYMVSSYAGDSVEKLEFNITLANTPSLRAAHAGVPNRVWAYFQGVLSGTYSAGTFTITSARTTAGSVSKGSYIEYRKVV
jgi:hypothetical protein